MPRPTPRQGISPLHLSSVEVMRTHRDILDHALYCMYVLCVRSDVGNLSGLIGSWGLWCPSFSLTFKFLFSVFAVVGVGIGVDICVQKEASREGAEVCCLKSSITARKVQRAFLCHCSCRKPLAWALGGVDKWQSVSSLSLAAFGGLESLWKIILDWQEQELRIHWRNETALC